MAGGGVWGGGRLGQNDPCIQVGSDENHFNVSLIVRDKVTRQCPQTTTFGEKGEPKRIRTEVPLLTSLTPYRQAKPAQEQNGSQTTLITPLLSAWTISKHWFTTSFLQPLPYLVTP